TQPIKIVFQLRRPFGCTRCAEDDPEWKYVTDERSVTSKAPTDAEMLPTGVNRQITSNCPSKGRCRLPLFFNF
ncbi:unnamed protein product, partial [Nesidiocoris tenuis]